MLSSLLVAKLLYNYKYLSVGMCVRLLSIKNYHHSVYFYFFALLLMCLSSVLELKNTRPFLSNFLIQVKGLRLFSIKSKDCFVTCTMYILIIFLNPGKKRAPPIFTQIKRLLCPFTFYKRGC